jgi:metal-responsive CopG/Arc/MetJ family transcriptional regulator
VATEDLTEALDIVYKGFGEISRSEAARDRISDFLERRKPEFKK